MPPEQCRYAPVFGNLPKAVPVWKKRVLGASNASGCVAFPRRLAEFPCRSARRTSSAPSRPCVESTPVAGRKAELEVHRALLPTGLPYGCPRGWRPKQPAGCDLEKSYSKQRVGVVAYEVLIRMRAPSSFHDGRPASRSTRHRGTPLPDRPPCGAHRWARAFRRVRVAVALAQASCRPSSVVKLTRYR